MLEREACRSVPFLLVAFEEVDRLNSEDPAKALLLATNLVRLAQRIEVYDGDPESFQTPEEKRDYLVLARAVLVSALFYSGRRQAAQGHALSIEAASGAIEDPFVAGETFRRLASVVADGGDHEKGIAYCTRAYAFYEKEGRVDLAALAALRRGVLKGSHLGLGTGTADFAHALWLATSSPRRPKSIRERVERTLCAASINLLRDTAAKLPLEQAKKVLAFVSRARKQIRGKSRAKTVALMLEGSLIAQCGNAYYGNKILVRALEMFIRLKAFNDAAVCVAEIISVVAKWDPLELGSAIAQCEELLKTCEEGELEWVGEWLAQHPVPELTEALAEELRERALGAKVDRARPGPSSA